MTTPSIDITEIVPKKWKPIIGLVGALLTFVVPFILSVGQYLPPGVNAAIGVVLAVATALGVYKAPYKPEGTTLAVDPSAETVSASVPANAPVARPSESGPVTPFQPGTYRDPWA